MGSRIRLQGTDGVRGVALPSDHDSVRALSPQEAFLERGVITEQFVELYSFCAVRCMMEWGEMEPEDEVVIGWDPRDEKGELARAAVRGVLKAGGKALTVGVLPTPAAPLFMLYRGARLSLVITASHNPADENGIKIFLPEAAMKPLPTEDGLISEAALKTDYRSLTCMGAKGAAEDVSDGAAALFKDFCCQGRNSWIERRDALTDLTVIVDPANGACTGFASEVFKRLGVGEVIEVNPSWEGPVNRGSGVTQLEGNRYIGPDLMGSGGRDFSANAAVVALFEEGRRKRHEMLAGRALVCAAVFDADGDRFYRVDYDAAEDMAVVLTGDEVSYLQAEYLMGRASEVKKGGLFITTVESDINVLSHVKALGMETALTGVGDKWILREIAERHLPAGACVSQRDAKSALSYLRLLKGRGLEAGQGWSTLCVGSEESGHNITAGWLEDVRGETIPVFIGNGLKSAVNSFAATASLRSRLPYREYRQRVREPFPPGFKKTYYVYHCDRDRFKRGSLPWNGLQSLFYQEVTGLLGGGCRVNKRRFSEDEDMLYLSVHEGGDIRAAIFARNSGTENKTGINLRGRERDGEFLTAVGLHGISYLAGELKSDATPMGEASLRILEILWRGGPLREGELRGQFDGVDMERLLDEMVHKEKSLRRHEGALHLSPLGEEICFRRFGGQE